MVSNDVIRVQNHTSCIWSCLKGIETKPLYTLLHAFSYSVGFYDRRGQKYNCMYMQTCRRALLLLTTYAHVVFMASIRTTRNKLFVLSGIYESLAKLSIIVIHSITASIYFIYTCLKIMVSVKTTPKPILVQSNIKHQFD